MDMEGPSTWKIFLLSLWLLGIGWECVKSCGDGTVPCLTRKDISLLADDEDPKCFTRTTSDFTCFIEVPDNQTHDFYYTIDDEKRCSTTTQRTEEGTFLHVCSFDPYDIYLYVTTHVRVLDGRTNTTLYQRDASVEDLLLLDPPVNVSLQHMGQPGQLRVAWRPAKGWNDRVRVMLRYSSPSLGTRTHEEDVYEHQVHKLISVEPGEVVQVQVRVNKPGHSQTRISGHWSDWSESVSAIVPQRGDDISLICYTSDLRNVTCQWDENVYGGPTYKLFYRSSLDGTADWRLCATLENVTNYCRFHGNESGVFLVKVRTGFGHLSRTFFTDPFTLNNSIKTVPPGQLKETLEVGRMCVQWEAPSQALSAHLTYQVRYQSGQEGTWMTVSLKGPVTCKCLDVPSGRQYCVQVRARPHGSFYAGHWSEWSPSLTGDIPTDIGVLLITCIPVTMLVVSMLVIVMFHRYFRMLKLYVWPPVPNLDKVLHGFLTEISRQTWDPPSIVKHSLEDAPASLVQIMGEEDSSPGEEKPPAEVALLPCADRHSSGEEQDVISPGVGLEVLQGYVTLNTDNVIQCQRGNEYVCSGKEGVEEEGCQCSCPATPRSSDILNRSYLYLAEPGKRGDCPGGKGKEDTLYANLEGTAQSK